MCLPEPSTGRFKASNQAELQEAQTVSRYAEPMARLIEELKKLPGVGTKSAQRFAFHILRSTDDDAAALAEAVRGPEGQPAPVLDLQQRDRHRPLRLLRQPCPQSAPGLRGGGTHQHRLGRTDSRLHGGLPRAPRAPSRPCMAWVPTSCGPARCFPVWSAAKWTR